MKSNRFFQETKFGKKTETQKTRYIFITLYLHHAAGDWRQANQQLAEHLPRKKYHD